MLHTVNVSLPADLLHVAMANMQVMKKVMYGDVYMYCGKVHITKYMCSSGAD